MAVPVCLCICDTVVVVGLGGVSVSIEGASKADIECNDIGDGRCCVTYHPTAPGLYVVNIHFADQPVQGTRTRCELFVK